MPPVENLFSSSPRMTRLYQVLLSTVESAVPPGFFQTVAKSCKASRKKSKSPGRATGRDERLHAVNRFALLQVED